MKTARIDQATDRRRSQLAMIHIAAKNLGLDQDTYRALVARVSAESGNHIECTSSADLDGAQRDALLEEFRRLGAKLPPKRSTRGAAHAGQYPGKPANVAQQPMLQKIEAQLTSMSLSWSYADAIAKRQFGVARIAWLRKDDQLASVIAALDVEQHKRALATELDRLIGVLHVTDKQLAHLTAGMKKTWRRNRDCLNAIVNALSARELLLADQSDQQEAR